MGRDAVSPDLCNIQYISVGLEGCDRFKFCSLGRDQIRGTARQSHRSSTGVIVEALNVCDPTINA
jgi:hypothetical protein